MKKPSVILIGAFGNCPVLLVETFLRGMTFVPLHFFSHCEMDVLGKRPHGRCGYDVRCFGYDPYNAKEFVERWAAENGPFGIEKVIQGAKTESVPLGELKKLAEDRLLIFDEELMTYAMGNCIAMEDTNGNRKLLKKRYEQKIDAVAAMMDAYIAYKHNPGAFE